MKSKVFLMVCVLAGLAAGVAMGQANDALFDAIDDGNENYLTTEAGKNWSSNRNALKYGKTALMYAAEKGWRPGVEILLDMKADPNVKGDGGKNALMLSALNNGDIEIMKLLVTKNGGNLSLRDDDGNTILMYAVQNRNLNMTIFLLERGADPTQKNNLGKNVFMWACEKGTVDIVRTLLNTGRIDMYENFSAVGSNASLPPLLWTINARTNPPISDSIIEEIIEYYSDSLEDIVDKDGNNALYYARLRNRNRAITLINKKGIRFENAVNSQR